MDIGLLAARARRHLAAILLAILCASSETALAQVPEIPVMGGGNWYRGGATLDMDFVHDKYWLNGTNYSGVANFISGAGATFTRSGTTNVTTTSPPSSPPFFLPSADTFVSRADSSKIATYFDNTGTLQTVASNGAGRTAAYYYSGSSWVLGGTLAEPAATNSIRNNTMSGAVAGTPGTLPTNWAIGSFAGLTTSIVGTGTSNGITYIDVQFSGTATSTFGVLFFDTVTGISAVQGQTWTNSPYIAVSGGSLANVGVQLIVQEETSGGVFIQSDYSSYVYPTSSLTRYSYTDTLSSATAGIARPGIILSWSNGAAINITLRIGLPQMEQSSYATSPIATTSAAITRAADVYSVPIGGTYFNSTGTLQQAAVNSPRLDYGSSGGSNPKGILVEESSTNSIRNNMMVDAVLADGVERTTGGTFSGCSGATCTGWTTTVNGGTGSVSFTSGTAALTGDGTNAASIYQAIPTVASYLYTIAVTNGAGNAVTVQAGTGAGGSTLLAATSIAASATTSYQFTASGTTSYVQINNTSTTAANVTAVSVQSAGKWPTDWLSGLSGLTDGLVGSIIAVSTDHGISYMDLQISGIAASAAPYSFAIDGASVIAASTGQIWTQSGYHGISAGSTSGISSIKLFIQEENSSGTSITTDSSSDIKSSIPTSGALSTYRANYTATLSNASTAYVKPYYSITPNNGSAINITLRIGMPQLEHTASGYGPTSVIPTYGSAATRAADVFTIGTSAAGANGAWYTAGVGTLGSVGSIPYTFPTTSGSDPGFVVLDDGTINNVIQNIIDVQNSGKRAIEFYSGGTDIYGPSIASPLYVAGVNCQEVVAFAAGSQGAGIDGVGQTAGTYASIPTFTTLRVGSNRAGNEKLDGWVSRIWYIPTREPNAALAGYSN